MLLSSNWISENGTDLRLPFGGAVLDALAWSKGLDVYSLMIPLQPEGQSYKEGDMLHSEGISEHLLIDIVM